MFKEHKGCWSLLRQPLKHGRHEMEKQFFLFTFKLLLGILKSVVTGDSDITYPLAY